MFLDQARLKDLYGRYSIDLGETAIHSRAADYYQFHTTPIVEIGDGIFRGPQHGSLGAPSNL